MQPGAGTNDDIHTILGRFNTWAAKQSTNDNRHIRLQAGSDEVRELAYEEAIRRYGSWPPAAISTAKTAEPVLRIAAQPVPVDSVATEMSATEMSEAAIAKAADIVPAVLPVPGDSIEAAIEIAANPAASAIHEKAALRKTAVAGGSKKISKTAEKAAVAAKSAKPAAETKQMVQAARPKAQGIRAAARSAKARRSVPAVKPNVARRAPFREVLAQTVRTDPVSTPAAAAHAGAERITRISIRFSAQEESRVRECAARAGLTVSAYLRERALGAEQTGAAPNLHATANRTAPRGVASLAEPQPLPGLRARFAGWFSRRSA